MRGKPLTGRKVLGIAVAFFGVIFAVNFFMASQAIGTFPGVVTNDSYARSQTFNVDRAAQEALGWSVAASLRDGELHLAVTDENGAPADVAEIDATLGHATHPRDDVSPDLRRSGTGYVAPVDIAPGNWRVDLRARAADGTAFRRQVALDVGD